MPINMYGQAIDDNPYILGATHSYKDMYRQGHKFTHIFLHLTSAITSSCFNVSFVNRDGQTFSEEVLDCSGKNGLHSKVPDTNPTPTIVWTQTVYGLDFNGPNI